MEYHKYLTAFIQLENQVKDQGLGSVNDATLPGI